MRDELQISLDERIGALELSATRLDDDGELVRAGGCAAAGPTSAPQFCVPTGRCVTDMALDMAIAPVAAGQTQNPQTCAMTLRVGLGC